jgi:nitroimidazol reductase NimA-like FMN-containing flavoprotein (pyridoxamine 5'-phosphate oxidase superfamily)
MDITPTKRTTINRIAEKAVFDRDQINSILDEGFIAHIAWADEAGQPYVIPTGYARDGDRILFHGSTGAGMFRALAAGAPACATITLLDGMVLARSAFESSMHYRSVVILGTCEVLEGDEKSAALDVMTDNFLPERRPTLRPMLKKEIAATLVLSLPLTEVSAKVSNGQPTDEDDDINFPVWAGTVPMKTVFGTPVPADNLAAENSQVPEYISRWK